MQDTSHQKYKEKKYSGLYHSILKEAFTVRLKPIYGLKGFLLRFGIDLLAANSGMFIGYLITTSYYFFTKTPEFLFGYYLASVPLFTVACMLSFPLAGLYSYGPGSTLIHRLYIIFRSVGLAFLVFVFGAYILQQIGGRQLFMLPRSSVLSGWIAVLILMISIRGGRIIFDRNFMVMPRTEPNKITFIVERLQATEKEMGWVSAETVASSRDKGRPIAARFALWPYFGEHTIDQVGSVLRSGKVNMWTGEQNALFGVEFAEFCGCKHAISVANGTVALELALRALNIGPGDEVIVPCRTFIASASSVVMCGAKPVLTDIDRESQNLTLQTIAKAINPRTKGIIAVHLAGWPCEMEPLMALARKYGIKVIEDCAQAHGAAYKGRPVGSLGDVAAFSFCQDKIMTTGGEGGMVTSNNDEIWERAWSIKDHGKNHAKIYNQPQNPGFNWVHEDFGTNWRMTELQAVIGREALQKLPEWVATRRKYAHMLAEAFSEIQGLRVTVPPDHVKHAYYKYYVFIKLQQLRQGWDQDRIMTAITDEGIPCFSGICGQIHREEAFRKNGILPTQELPVSAELMQTSLMFLVHPTLAKKNIEDTIQAVKKVMGNAV